MWMAGKWEGRGDHEQIWGKLHLALHDPLSYNDGPLAVMRPLPFV